MTIFTRTSVMTDKAKLAEDILFKMGDMHTHHDIEELDGGYAVIRTFEIDEHLVENDEGYMHARDQVCLWKPTRDELYDHIINVWGKGML
jgi:hypothetical protein